MKQFILHLIVISLFLTACGSGSEPQESKSTEQENQVIGTYSGILRGSSGYFTVTLKEKGSVAHIKFDNIEKTIVSDKTLKKGDPIENLRFVSEEISLNISIDEEGVNPVVEAKAPGHNIVATVEVNSVEEKKEIVRLYEGTFSRMIKNENDTTFRVDGEQASLVLMVKDQNFTLLKTVKCANCNNNGKVFMKKGTITEKTDRQLSVVTTHRDNGTGTPLLALDDQVIEQSANTFNIDETGNLSLIATQHIESNTGYGFTRTTIKYEYYYKLISK